MEETEFGLTAPEPDPAAPMPARLLAGEGPPTRKLGTTGDHYIDLAAWELYGPKRHGHWRDGLRLQARPRPKPRRRTTADDLPLATAAQGLVLTTASGGVLSGDAP